MDGPQLTRITPSDTPGNRLLTIRQFAELEGFTERQVRHLIRSCGLPVYRVNGIRIRHSDYVAWLETRRSA